MSKKTIKLEQKFESLGRWLYDNRFKSSLFISLLIGFFLYNFPKITIDTSFERGLRKNDAGLVEYNSFRNQFGYEKRILCAIQGPKIFRKEFILKLNSFHNDLKKEVPFLKGITSLINARTIRSEGDQLIVEDLFEGWPENEVDFLSIQKRVNSNISYLNTIISESGDTTAIIIEIKGFLAQNASGGDLFDGFEDKGFLNDQPDNRRFLTEKEVTSAVDAVRRITDRYESHDFRIAITGSPVIEDAYNRITRKDMTFLLMIATVIVGLFILILFRRVSGIFLPFIIVYAALFSTFGLMAFLKVSITEMTTVLPTFLVVVGTADAVHILSHFYRRIDQGDDKKTAISHALGYSGPAILMTSLTTVAGLLSFSFSELSTIGELGLFSAIGVVFALFYTVTILPVLLAMIPVRHSLKFIKVTPKNKVGIINRVLLSFADFAITHPAKIIIGSTLIFILSIVFIFKLQFFMNIVTYFPDSMKVKQDLLFIDKELKGTRILEIVVDSKQENGIYDPDLLNRIEMFSKSIEKKGFDAISVGKVFSLNTIIKETHQALHGNDSSYYQIPQDRDTVAQELFLFESSGDKTLERLVDSQFSKTRVSIKIPWVEIFATKKFIAHIQKQLDEIFKSKADITLTGGMAVLAKTVPSAMHNMGKSYLLAFVVITFMMVILVEDLKLGLVSMIPNLLPIFTVMGLMGVAEMPMDLTSLMIGSIAMGLVVDDTMHFMYNFKRYYEITGDKHIAVRNTLLGTGRAMLITTLVLSSGFFVGVFATLKNIAIFGFFTGMTIILALLADFLLAPALVVLMKHK